ncbi:hypothetical protein D6764_02010 [Candidatus Woesearchaeota archaeon]|nr:MAG: hypothetical protein D6764_02010 [Candidatus Woesearchaeota archaeon]
MKGLFFADLHSSIEILEEIEERVKTEKCEFLACAGDMTTFENKLDTVLFKISEIGVPALIIHGNHESEDKVRLYCDMFPNLVFIHKKVAEINGIIIAGYGGGGFSETDGEFRKAAKVFRKKMKKGKTTVLMLHGPPHGTLLDELDGSHHGNRDFTKFIKEVQPSIVICGHFHENAGKEDTLGKSRIINPGPRGIILDL